MSRTEQRRLMVLNHLESGALVNREAAELLGLSVRQLRRLRSAYREQGAAALAHGNRGRRPAHALDPELARQVVELATSKYQGLNQQHLTELLAENEGIQLSRVSVHRVLKAAGVPAPRRRRPPRHRRRRDRYPREGMLLQIDASRHDWLEGRGPILSLVGGIDDATGLVPAATFRLQEDAQGYFQMLRTVAIRRGLPMAVYCDRHGIFFTTKDKELSLEEQLLGRPELTQFARLLNELGIQLILARSPQAKGRVERLWGTFQDRLGSELRLASAGTLDQANAVLERYLERHNRRFTVAPSDPALAWQPTPKRLNDFFCFKFHRVVANDHTVRFGASVIDVSPPAHRTSLAKARVEVHERFDSTVAVFFQGVCVGKATRVESVENYRLRDRTKPAPPPLGELKQKSSSQPTKPGLPWRRGPNHPWRVPFPR